MGNPQQSGSQPTPSQNNQRKPPDIGELPALEDWLTLAEIDDEDVIEAAAWAEDKVSGEAKRLFTNE